MQSKVDINQENERNANDFLGSKDRQNIEYATTNKRDENLYTKPIHSVLTSRNPKDLVALWNDNTEFRNSLNDKLIDFSKDKQVILDQLQNLSLYFQCVLRTQRSKFINTIWQANPILQAWYSGEDIDFNQNKQGFSPALFSISFQQLVNHFNEVLKSHSSPLILEFWNKNALLRSWYTGHKTVVDKNAQGQPVTETLSNDALLDIFKSIITSQCALFSKLFWEENPTLAVIFSDNVVNSSNHLLQSDLKKIAFDKLIELFNLTLVLRHGFLTKTMWEINPFLQQWVCGHDIMFINKEDKRESYTISFAQMLQIFESALRGQSAAISLEIWNQNDKLQSFLLGNEVTHLGEKHTISLNQLLNFFEMILKVKNSELINKIWDNNAMLSDWFSGKSLQVGLNNNNQPIMRVATAEMIKKLFAVAVQSRNSTLIKKMHQCNPSVEAYGSFEELIHIFMNAFKKQCKGEALNLYKKNPLLQNWLSGLAVKSMTEGLEEEKIEVISLDQSIECFERAVSLNLGQIISFMWDTNPFLKKWYSGQPIKIGENNQGQAQTRTIEFKNLVHSFIHRFCKDKYKQSGNRIWKANSALRAWLHGHPIQLGTEPSTPSWDEFLENFHALLDSSTDISNTILQNTEVLRYWLSGFPINLGTTEKQNLQIISLDNLKKFYIKALRYNIPIAQFIWHNNVALQSWFNGIATNFGTHLMPDMRVISQEERNTIVEIVTINKKATLPLKEKSAINASPLYRNTLFSCPVINVRAKHTNYLSCDVDELSMVVEQPRKVTNCHTNQQVNNSQPTQLIFVPMTYEDKSKKNNKRTEKKVIESDSPKKKLRIETGGVEEIAVEKYGSFENEISQNEPYYDNFFQGNVFENTVSGLSPFDGMHDFSLMDNYAFDINFNTNPSPFSSPVKKNNSNFRFFNSPFARRNEDMESNIFFDSEMKIHSPFNSPVKNNTNNFRFFNSPLGRRNEDMESNIFFDSEMKIHSPFNSPGKK